jgi:hypothetical protein
MGEYAEEQLTTEELTLKRLTDQLDVLEDQYNLDVQALNDTYDYYSEQFNILQGIDTSVKSVESAINLLHSALSQYSSASGGSYGTGVISGYDDTIPSEGGIAGTYTNESGRVIHAFLDVGNEVDAIYDKYSTASSIDWEAAEKEIFDYALSDNIPIDKLAQAMGIPSSQIEEAADRWGVNISSIDGSHFNGLDRVPFDGYTAELHKNEMVLTAPVAQTVRDMAYNSSDNSTEDLSYSLLSQLIKEFQNHSYNTNKKLIKLERLERIIDKWDETGLPKERNYDNPS